MRNKSTLIDFLVTLGKVIALNANPFAQTFISQKLIKLTIISEFPSLAFTIRETFFELFDFQTLSGQYTHKSSYL
jgi:hypothetical protein